LINLKSFLNPNEINIIEKVTAWSRRNG